MTLPFALALVVLSAEDLKDLRYRAVTLEPLEHRAFQVENLETVTGSTGRCVSEGMEPTDGSLKVFYVEAECSGVRTTIVWKKDNTRMHLMACAEDDTRTEKQLKLRKKLEKELKKHKAVTACVHAGRVELWGWVMDEADKAFITKLTKGYAADEVKSMVELVQPE